MPAVNFRMVRLGRELRGLSQTGLAERSNVSQAVLSRIESDVRVPSEHELNRITRALGLPHEFFFEPDTPAAAPLYRKRAIRSARRNRLIQARVNTAVLAARRIFDAGIDVDAPLAFPERGEIPDDDPLEAARLMRRAWRLPTGRVDDVTGLIESAGGIVLEVDFGCDEASAAFVASLADGRLWFLVNTREHAGERVRLSLAHEIGHAVMHRNLAAQDEARLEQEAYAFAIALLLPLDDFDIHVGPDLTLRRARDLKRAYWVSIQAITRTARDRRLITPERYTSLYKQISSRGWRSVEPEPIPRERPTIWPNALDVHRNRHGYRNEDFARIARLGLTDLQDLFPTTFGPRLRVVPGGLSQGPELRPSEPKRHTA